MNKNQPRVLTPVLNIPVGPNGEWRRCQECAHSNRECDWCESKGKRINRAMYACPDFATPEQKIAQIKRQAEIKAAKTEQMLNFLLTAMCISATATQHFLLDFCSFFEQTKEESDWRHKRAQAANEILNKAERIQSLHAQFFQADMNKVYTDHGQKEFDAVQCDNHTKDTYEFDRLIMLYIDRCWGDEEKANKIIEFIESLPSEGIFSDEDIERFRMKE